MTALLIVLIGAALVLAGIIGLRLHAFLALVGAALVVVWLAPQDARVRDALRLQAAEVAAYDPATGVLTPTPGTAKALKAGGVRIVKPERAADQPEALEGTLQIGPEKAGTFAPERGEGAIEPGDWVVPMSAWTAAQKASVQNPGEVVAKGFGDACASIGLLIAFAAVIGVCMMESGAAERIVVAMQNALGERRTPLAFVGSGYLLGIPVFFDTVFYLLMPLGRALRQKTGRDYALYIMCIVAGATMTHSLVPPTPGPLFVADAFGVPIGTMILAGSLLGVVTVTAGYFYARWANARWDIPLREVAGAGEDVRSGVRELPPLFMALAPIIVPIGLIAGAGVMQSAGGGNIGGLQSALQLLGNKNVALGLGTLAALLLLARARGWKWDALVKPVAAAVESGGTVLLITAAGGAFGYALRVTDIAGVVAGWFGGDRGWLLPAAFAITTLIRTAQGSATVAMVTAAGILAPIASTIPLGYHPVYLALAVGCGSKPFSWMNDSGFWIISRMSGMTEGETLRTASTLMAIMAVVGLLTTMLGAWLLPFAG